MGHLMSEEERKEQLRLKSLLPLAMAAPSHRKIVDYSDTVAMALSTATVHEGQSLWDMAACSCRQLS
jgi:hypothetical protein